MEPGSWRHLIKRWLHPEKQREFLLCVPLCIFKNVFPLFYLLFTFLNLYTIKSLFLVYISVSFHKSIVMWSLSKSRYRNSCIIPKTSFILHLCNWPQVQLLATHQSIFCSYNLCSPKCHINGILLCSLLSLTSCPFQKLFELCIFVVCSNGLFLLSFVSLVNSILL